MTGKPRIERVLLHVKGQNGSAAMQDVSKHRPGHGSRGLRLFIVLPSLSKQILKQYFII
jgi:hypothetical protein